MIKKYLKKKLSKASRRKLRNVLSDLKAVGFGNNLDKLARIYRTDKFGSHFYTPHYTTHIRPFKFKRIKLLEIGVGGYGDPYNGGNSLRMWKKYFPLGKIYAIDIFDKSALMESRVKIFKGSQSDAAFLNKVTDEIGELDIIIDDGSHINKQVIKSFNILFPKLKDGGIYVIEDTQTSYWEEFGGDSKDLSNPKTMMNYFKRLTDSLNHEEFIIKNYQKTYFDRKIISMHFYHNLIFIYKGNNNECSNMIVNNQKTKYPLVEFDSSIM